MFIRFSVTRINSFAQKQLLFFCSTHLIHLLYTQNVITDILTPIDDEATRRKERAKFSFEIKWCFFLSRNGAQKQYDFDTIKYHEIRHRRTID